MFLGIDVGTFESKGVLIDASGRVLAQARRRHGIQTPATGHVEQSPEDVWWADVCAIARELTAHAAGEDLAAVGVSAIGPCVVATDAAFTPLRPAILYGVDTRAGAQIDRITARLGPEEIARRTGTVLTSQSAGPKIAWLADEEPEVWRAARWFLTSQSWLVARLTGEVTMDHATAAYFHPLYDLQAQRWDVAGCEDFVDVGRLPRLGWSSEIAGVITAAASSATGIREGTPVIIGTTDAPAEAVAAGAVTDGDLMAMYGSSGYFIRVGERLHRDERLWSAPFVFDGSYVLAAGTSTAGTATRWLADILSLSATDDEQTFGDLVRLSAQSPPGANGVLALPHFAGERTPFQDPSSRAAVVGLGLAHTRADVARAVLEGIGHSFAAAIGTIADAGAPISRVLAIGGATRNRVILATVATVTGLEQVVIDSAGAASGDAILAAMGVGAFQDPASISAWVVERDRVRADPTAHERLRADHLDYLALYRALADLNRRRAQTS